MIGRNRTVVEDYLRRKGYMHEWIEIPKTSEIDSAKPFECNPIFRENPTD
jgi:hypothetical protein